MPLRATIQASPETLSDLLLAADDRYREAEELLTAEEFDGCVYLFGYAAEMWLKAACLTLQGLGAAAQVKAALPALKTWMKLNAPGVPFQNYYDLSFLGQCVIQLRNHQGRPLSAGLATELQTRIMGRLYDEWIVDMRYRRSGLTVADAWAALGDAWWLETNWVQLT